MKIVWVAPGMYISGGLRIIIEYANRLQDRGHEVTLVSLRDPELLHFPIHVPFTVAADLDNVSRNADVVIATAHDTVPSVLSCAGNARRYYFIQNRESLFARDPRLQRSIEMHYSSPLIPITVSHWLAGVVALHGKEVFVVHNGLDTVLFHQTPGLQSEGLRVVAEGQHTPWKRLDMAVAAARRAGADEVWALSVKSAPDGVDQTFRDVATDEVARVYSSCNAMVKLPDFEGYPAPQAEAMSCRCAVVTTDAPGTMEYCTDGENCLLTPLRDADAAAHAVSMLRDPELRSRLVEGGRRTVETMFGWDDKVSALETILSGTVEPSDLPCPFHTRQQIDEFVVRSRPYTLPLWQCLRILGESAPYGLGDYRHKSLRAILGLTDALTGSPTHSARTPQKGI